MLYTQTVRAAGSSTTETFKVPFVPTWASVLNQTGGTLELSYGTGTNNAVSWPPSSYYTLPLESTGVAESTLTAVVIGGSVGSTATIILSDQVLSGIGPGNIGTLAITGGVSVTGGRINIGTMPAVTINSSGSSPIYVAPASSATFTVGGSVSVSGGSINIGTMPAVTINSSGSSPIYVAPASSATFTVGGNVTVSGTVNIGSNNTVTISSSSTAPVYVSNTTDITLAASDATIGYVNLNNGATVDVGTVDSITAGNLSVTNDILPANNLVFLCQAGVTITDLAVNGTFAVMGDVDNTNKFPYAQLGLWDGYVVEIYSSGGYDYSMYSPPTPIATSQVSQVIGAFASGGTSEIWSPNTFPLTMINGGYTLGVSCAILYSSPAVANIVNTYWINNRQGSTIASDTVTVNVWGIKSGVSNPNAIPVQQSPATGAFGTANGYNTNRVTLANGSPTQVMASGGIMTQVRLSIVGAPSSYTLQVSNGGEVVWVGTLAASPASLDITLDFPQGTANNGIFLALGGEGTSATLPLGGYVMITDGSTAPQSVEVVS